MLPDNPKAFDRLCRDVMDSDSDLAPFDADQYEIDWRLDGFDEKDGLSVALIIVFLGLIGLLGLLAWVW